MRILILTATFAAGLTLTACAATTPTAEPAPAATAALAPTAAVATPEAASPTVGTGAVDSAAWDAALAEWIAPGNLLCDAPGAVLLVDSPAGRYLKAAGVASLDDKRPLEAGDRLEIGSNTKAFTVILALLLQEAGVLDMDDPLSKWLPELAARIPNGGEVTLRQLAGNVSGIADYADPMMQPVIDANDQVGVAKSYKPEELVDFAITQGKPDFAPGQGWHYSSTNFILLGMVVEAATGKSLSELYQERIFDPLGMADTTYLTASPEPGSIVDGYYKLADGQMANMTAWNGTQGGAAGAIVSTAEDMARFASGLFGGQIFKDEATLEEMTALRELSADEGAPVIAAYGLGLMAPGVSGYKAIGHAGQTPGFQSLWFRVPEADATFVLLTNSGSCHVMLLPSSIPAANFGLP